MNRFLFCWMVAILTVQGFAGAILLNHTPQSRSVFFHVPGVYSFSGDQGTYLEIRTRLAVRFNTPLSEECLIRLYAQPHPSANRKEQETAFHAEHVREESISILEVSFGPVVEGNLETLFKQQLSLRRIRQNFVPFIACHGHESITLAALTGFDSLPLLASRGLSQGVER